MSIKWISWFCTILCFVFTASSQVISHVPEDNSQRKILTTDKIHITISEIPELSGAFNIDESGMVGLKLIGKVQVEGLTPNEVEDLSLIHI